MSKQTIPQRIDSFLDDIQAVLLSFLVKLGPFFVALMPALFTGYAIFYTFEKEAGRVLAIAFALTVALAIETVGIVATHTAIDLYNGWRSKAIDGIKVLLMIGLVPFYILGVAGTVWFAKEAFSQLVWALGIVSPFLTCIVYIAVALARDLTNIKQRVDNQQQVESEQSREDRAYKRDIERLKLRMEQERQLKEMEIAAQTQVEQSKITAQAKQTELASKIELKRLEADLAQQRRQAELDQARIAQEQIRASLIICDRCGKDDFKTVQARNAHLQFCPGKKETVSENGSH